MVQKLKIIVRVQPRTYLENFNSLYGNFSLIARRIIISCLLFITFFPTPVYAVDSTPCVDADSIAKGFGPCPAGLNQLEQVVGNIISVIVGLGFIALLVLIVMAGFKYLTSGGEPKAIQSAHHTLIWALLGILFMAIAWLVLQLIFNFTGINVTIFDIKTLCGDKTTLPFCQP